jgi:hypothetical protein
MLAVSYRVSYANTGVLKQVSDVYVVTQRRQSMH